MDTLEQAATLWRDSSAPCEWEGRTVYTGISYSGRYYLVDERDALPADLVSFNELAWQGIKLDGSAMANHGEELECLLRAIQSTEKGSGMPVTVSLGEFEYESDARDYTCCDCGAPFESFGVNDCPRCR